MQIEEEVIVKESTDEKVVETSDVKVDEVIKGGKNKNKGKQSNFPKGTNVYPIIRETNPVYNVRATVTAGRLISGINSVILLPGTRVVLATNIEANVAIEPDIETLYTKNGFDCRFYYSESEGRMMAVVTNQNPSRREFNSDNILGKVI